MGSLAPSAERQILGGLELQQLDDHAVDHHDHRARAVGSTARNEHHQRAHELVLDSPDPPSLLREVCSSAKEALFPSGNRKRNQKPPSRRIASCFLALFPILRWGRNYKATKFKHDLMAGLTLASLCIPQSIGYANLAKLDPQYGLYTSVVPPLIYALMGSSRELAIGPVAVVSLLLSSLVPQIQDPDSDPVAYTRTVFTVTFFAGLFQASFGIFRLGFLVDFLSHAAIVGFMAGAAIVIGLQQLRGLLGINHFTTKTDVVSVLKSVVTAIFHEPLQPLNVVIGSSFLIFLLVARHIGKKNKKLFWLPAIGPLISVILSTVIVYLTKADKHGVKIVKHIHEGLNPSSIHQLQLGGPHVAQIAKTGLICAIIALTEAIAVGRSFASIKGYHLDGNTEMIAMGFMNIAGSLTSCYVATGSFSRTAVNFSAGCETVVSNIVMAVTVLVSLELLTKLLYFTPMAILASIILSALPGLIDIGAAYHIWKLDKLDFLACVGAFFGVLFASVEIGLLIAIVISFAKILLHSMRPGVEVIGRLPRTDIFCEVSKYPMACKAPGILVIRIDSGLLCFANANFVRQRIMRLVKEEEDALEETVKCNVKVVVIDMSSVTNIDVSGISALEELQKTLLLHGIGLAVANPKWQVIQKMKLANFVDKIGRDRIFLTVGEAIEGCLGAKLASSSAVI